MVSHDSCVIPPSKQNPVITKEQQDVILSSLWTLQMTCKYFRIECKMMLNSSKLIRISHGCIIPPSN